MEKVSVVIPVYGQWHLAKRNVDALMQFDRQYIEEIIIIDDCSPEKNPYDFDSQLVRVIANEHNKGYAGTVNNGLKRASSEIIVLLDSDAYPVAPFIKRILDIYANDSTVGCIGFGTVDDYGNKTGSYTYEPSLLGLIVGQQLEAKLKLRRNDNILPYSCSVSFRTQCLEEVGYLNEEAFPVLDADLDISMHIHRSKWKLLFADDIIVSHSGGHSYKINYKRVLIFHDSRWTLLKIHGLIPFPRLARMFLKTRIRMELMVFKLLTLVSKGNGDKYQEKATGRRFLLQNTDSYT